MQKNCKQQGVCGQTGSGGWWVFDGWPPFWNKDTGGQNKNVEWGLSCNCSCTDFKETDVNM